MMTISDKVARHRLSICLKCEKLKRKAMGIMLPEKMWRCGVCGCFVHLKTKAKWAKCPLKKWS